MLYQLIKIFAKIAVPFYCRDIRINTKQIPQHKGPLLLAVNHPNSFLDAIILCSLFNRPVYSLARGDAFKNKFFAKILYHLKMFPVYRVSEGVENMDENYKTFDACKKIFKQNGTVLIFSEGRCINEWHLRPLKKGTARLAISSWEEGIDLTVLPVGINYNSFTKFGKNIHLNFGEPINKEQIDFKNSHGNAIKQFNETLNAQLKNLVYEIEPDDHKKIQEVFFVQQSLLKKILLFVPAIFGFILNAPIYYFIKWLHKTLVKEPGHFDSVIIGFLLLLYPFYLLAICCLLFFYCGIAVAVFGFILLPLFGFCTVQLKRQF